MEPRLRVGVVGAGYIAGRHVGHLLAMPDVEVVGIADPQPDRAGALAARCGAAAYARSEDLLAATEPDAVYVCVPPYAHGPVEAAVIERRLPMFVEKPLATDLVTAEGISAALAQTGSLAVTGYHWRWLDTVERAQDLLQSSPARLVLGSWLDRAPGTLWWGTQALSGGQVVEQVTHLVDLARLLVGEVVSVRAEGARSGDGPGDVLDAYTAMLRFDTGALGSFAATCLLRRGHRMGLELLAPGRAIALTEQDMLVDDGSGPVHTRPRLDPMARGDRDFVDAALGRPAEIRTPYAEALRTHRVALRMADAATPAHAGGPS